MKNVSVLALMAAVLLFANLAQSQEIDSLILPITYCMPGDTVSLSLFLRNASFPVGGFSAKVMLIDSTLGRFVGAYRGEAVRDFAFYQAPWTDGSVKIAGIYNLPYYEPVPPLPLGRHEIAKLIVAVSDSIELGSYLNVFFDRTGTPLNMITDSSGYEIAEPFTVDGMILIGQAVGLEENIQAPLKFELKNNYPNPFNANTVIEFMIAEPAFVQLDIYDVLGKKIRNLYNDFASIGIYSITWDGKSNNNQPMASGIYFYRLSYGNNNITRKMSLLK